MKVLLIGEYPMKTGESVGGVQAVTYALSRELGRRSDVELHVVAYQIGIEGGDSIGCDGYTLHYVPASPEGNLLTQGREDRRRLNRVFEEIGPDIIHANQAGVHALAALDSRFPTVLTVHGIFSWLGAALYGNSIKGRLRRFLFERIHKESLRRAGHVIVISPYVWDVVGSLSKARTYDIANPVDAVYFEQEATSPENRLLFVGLISPRKGVDHLLRAFRTVVENNPEVRLDIIGKIVDQEFFDSLQSYIQGSGLQNNVSWLGTMGRDALAAHYASSSMLVLPSLEETAPCVISEAMAAGCPVIASRVGGVPVMIDDGRDGLLVEPRDVEGLAAAMLKLLKDNSLRQSMSEHARCTALERYAPSSVAAQTIAVYRQVIEAEGGTI